MPSEDFHDVYIGRRAARWIDKIADDFPWHLFVSFVGPHDPFDPPAEYAELYRDAAMPEAIAMRPAGKPGWVQKRQQDIDAAELAFIRRQYCALITLIDEQIGLLIDALEARGMLDNTVIIFTSDHGEMLGDHGLFQKSLPYEPSTHIPLIAAGPGIDSGQTSQALVDMSDINPTICELAGLAPASGMDARSFAGLLSGGGEHRREIVSALGNFRCLRDETHKFVQNVNDRDELYDLVDDPGETVNLAEDDADRAGQMRARLDSFFRRAWQ